MNVSSGVGVGVSVVGKALSAGVGVGLGEGEVSVCGTESEALYASKHATATSVTAMANTTILLVTATLESKIFKFRPHQLPF